MFYGILANLGDVVLAELGLCHVAHHDVAATEAHLALLLLAQVLFNYSQ